MNQSINLSFFETAASDRREKILIMQDWLEGG